MQYSVGSQNGVFIPPSIKPPFEPSDLSFPTDLQTYAFNYNVFTKWSFELPYNFKISAGLLVNFNKFGIQNMLYKGELYNNYFFKAKTFDPTFNPSFSVLKSFNQKVSVYAKLSTGNTPPLVGDIIQGDGSVNHQLEPEDAVQYEVGSKGRLWNDRINYKLALFDLKITNRLITFYQNDVSYTTNLGKEQNKGLELFLGYQIIRDLDAPVTNLSLQVSYTYSHFRYEKFKMFEETPSGGSSVKANYSGNVVAGVPKHMFNIGVDMNMKAGFYLSAGLKHRGKTPVTFDNKKYLKAYNVLSAKIGYRHDFGEHFGFNLYVGSNNLTGSTYYKFLFVGQNVSALGDGYIAPAPYEPAYYGQVSLSYNI